MISSIVILTGAGISAESGVATFRDKDGIWSKVDYRDVATPQGFARDPGKVHDFYNMRRRAMAGVRPNAAHVALARLERAFSGDFLLVTQNIDDLHEQAGSDEAGPHAWRARQIAVRRLRRSAGMAPGSVGRPRLRKLWGRGLMRPDVVWFGEMPYRMEEISAALARCDLFVSIGTSGTVYPAAGFVAEARAAGARTVELNLEPSAGSSLFAETRHGPATSVVPDFVERFLFSG